MDKEIEPTNLIGKIISNVENMHKPGYDDSGWLRLTFTDGTSCIIESSYGTYTGKSIDEYPSTLFILDDVENLVPISDGKSSWQS
jgi:hypothetical protein